MLAVGRVIERYTVEAELGAGGVATVYRVRHNQLGSRHALKVLQLHGQKIRERLIEEGQAQARLKHPNIVSVTDVIDVDGAPGLIMEYVEGLSLDRWLRLHSPTLPQAEALFRGILAGVARAHRDGLVHRDLKPGNVLIDATEDGLVPKVADFGLAKALIEDTVGRAETRSGIAMGTPAYMAPEQVRDAKNVDQRADIFALGCILYELCCGASPFEAPDVLTIFSRLAAGSYPPPEVANPDLPPRLRNAIVGCLANRREERIPDCASLRAILDGAAYTPPPGALPAWTPPDEPTVSSPPPRSPSTPTFPADSVTLRVPPSGAAETIALTRAEPGPLASGGAASASAGGGGAASGGAASGSEISPGGRARGGPGGAPPRGGMGVALAGAALVTLLVAAGVVTAGGWWWASRSTGGAATTTAPPSSPAAGSAPGGVPSPGTGATAGSTSPGAPSGVSDPTAAAPTASEPTAGSATGATGASPPGGAGTSGLAGSPPGGSPSTTSTSGGPTSGGTTSGGTTSGGTTSGGTTSTSPAAPTGGATSPAPSSTAASPRPTGGAGTVTVTGDAEAVWLEGDAGRVEPGAVPEGTYRIKAVFSGATVGAGSVTVRAGQAVTLVCNAEFQRCKAR